MDNSTKKELTEYLRKFASEDRWQKIKEVAELRTRHITVVLEDIYQPHNASAVLRSCEGFGIQDVHIIENKNDFDPNSQVTIGADRWLNLHTYNRSDCDNTEECFSKLKASGYRVIATTPHEHDINLNALPIEGRTALVFGSEIDGISDRAKELADGFMKIPMSGFSESFNISVSAAICLYNITRRLRNSDVNWQLSEDETFDLRLEWLKTSIKASEQLEKKFLQNKNK
jgi:tRNA (guanosine-2'-O-)-methyltransferase